MKAHILILFVIFYSLALCQDKNKTIHVFVALCDNEHQGIVPVQHILGNGDDPKNNLYWGALYGVKSFFKRSNNWQLQSSENNPTSEILERCIFKHATNNVYLIADAYRGIEIKKTINDFFQAASGNNKQVITIEKDNDKISLGIGGNAKLITYIGHNGLMEFDLDNDPVSADSQVRDLIVLACSSREFFCDPLLNLRAKPLLLTTGLMAPEAYTLESAIEGWILNESNEQIKLRAASAYSTYQRCSIRAATNLFSTSCNR